MTLYQRERENIEQGFEQGENRKALLTKQLIKASRCEDLERATDITRHRKLLFWEFGI